MNLTDLFRYFMPKEKRFYTLFDQAATCCFDASVELSNLMNEGPGGGQKAICSRMKEIEQKGDEITGQVLNDLNLTFITPFDREDIHKLANTLDDVVDLIYKVSAKIELYRLTNFSKNMKDMAAEIHVGCSEIQTAVQGLRNFKNSDDTLKACRVLNKLEERVDQYFQLSILNLFDNEKDAIELIKQKDILFNFEKIANRIKDVSDIIKTILVKYA